MAFDLRTILYNFPEIRKPPEKRLSFNAKLKWTALILGSFFIMANITLFGLAQDNLSQLQFLQTILASEFGTITTLGIGPIVISSIILQLLVGSGILNIDTKSEEGKRYFSGLQKLGVIFFIIFEALVYVFMGGLKAAPGYTGILIFQIVLGGLAIMYMDEVCQKWGFGSGVSLFIVAGVAWALFNSLFQFIGPSGQNCLANFATGQNCVGNVLVILQSIIKGAPVSELLAAATPIFMTTLIFLLVVWTQSLKVEIPLSYERLRGYGIKWPLAFFYASVIPVILAGALLANLQLFGTLIQNWLGHATFLGNFIEGRAISGLAFWLQSSNVLESVIRGSFSSTLLLQSAIHLSFYMIFSALFAVFWVKTSGMDESSQAKNILSSGLQLPGFRKDPRVLESILKRYIMPLTIMGGLAVGFLAGIANLLGALTGGTSILLAVMIMYQLYQSIAHQHALDMHPAMKKIFG